MRNHFENKILPFSSISLCVRNHFKDVILYPSYGLRNNFKDIFLYPSYGLSNNLDKSSHHHHHYRRRRHQHRHHSYTTVLRQVEEVAGIMRNNMEKVERELGILVVG